LLLAGLAAQGHRGPAGHKRRCSACGRHLSAAHDAAFSVFLFLEVRTSAAALTLPAHTVVVGVRRSCPAKLSARVAYIREQVSLKLFALPFQQPTDPNTTRLIVANFFADVLSKQVVVSYSVEPQPDARLGVFTMGEDVASTSAASGRVKGGKAGKQPAVSRTCLPTVDEGSESAAGQEAGAVTPDEESAACVKRLPAWASQAWSRWAWTPWNLPVCCEGSTELELREARRVVVAAVVMVVQEVRSLLGGGGALRRIRRALFLPPENQAHACICVVSCAAVLTVDVHSRYVASI
jgi:hypothetical protein